MAAFCKTRCLLMMVSALLLTGCALRQPGPLLGDRFPDIKAMTTNGPMVLPDNYQGRWLLFFSHPGDFTPVCTTEFVAFQQHLDEFNAINCELLGLSVDPIEDHVKWIEWIEDQFDVKITFPIIADPDAKIARRLGLIHPGRAPVTVRAAYIVDPNSIVRAIIYYPPELGRSTAELFRAVRGLQLGDRYHVSMPGDWPNNSIIGSDVILKPEFFKAFPEDQWQPFDCYAEWFCHKQIPEAAK